MFSSYQFMSYLKTLQLVLEGGAGEVKHANSETFKHPEDTTEQLLSGLSTWGLRWTRWTGAHRRRWQYGSDSYRKDSRNQDKGQRHSYGSGSVNKWVKDWRHSHGYGTGQDEQPVAETKKKLNCMRSRKLSSTFSHQIYPIIVPTSLLNPSTSQHPHASVQPLTTVPLHYVSDVLPTWPPPYQHREFSKPHIWSWPHGQVLQTCFSNWGISWRFKGGHKNDTSFWSVNFTQWKVILSQLDQT